VPRRVAGRQLDLLRRARDFRLLFLAALGSALGSRLAVTALLVDVWDRTDSGKWVGALLVADFLPTILIAVLLGPLVDRFSRRRLMIASDLVRFAAFCALPFATGPGMVVVLAGVVGFGNGFFRPALYAALPNLLDDDELEDANSIFQGRRERILDARPAPRRRAADVLGPRRAVLGECRDVPVLRGLDRAHPELPVPGGAAGEPRPLARPY